MNAAMTMDIDHAEAILRVEKGSEVNYMSLKKLKEIYYYLLKIILSYL